MNNGKKSFFILLIAILVGAGMYLIFETDALPFRISGSSGQSVSSSVQTGTTAGQLAPNIEGQTVDGEKVQLSDYRGRVVLVNLFASWCGPCLAETPHLVDVYTSSGQDAVFIGLNFRESPDAVDSYREDFDVPYPLVLNQDGELTEIFQPVGLPTSWFIDQEGVVRYVHSGPMTAEMIEIALDAAASGQKPDFSQITG